MTDLIEKAKKIKLAIFDVDGVLTEGGLFYSKKGSEFKQFNVHDGLGIKFLQKASIEVGIITACSTKTVEKRMSDLGVKYVYQGQMDKLEAYEDLKKKLRLSDEQILYVGDDFPDLPILCRVGIGVTVPGAHKIIKQYTALVTTSKGGHGAVREVCDFILEAQDLYQSIIKPYLP